MKKRRIQLNKETGGTPGMKKKWFLIGTAGLFAADQILKTYAEQNLDKKEERKLAGPVVLRRVHNKGMCFGLLSDRRKS